MKDKLMGLTDKEATVIVVLANVGIVVTIWAAGIGIEKVVDIVKDKIQKRKLNQKKGEAK